jgi:hypothetical protein
MRKIIALSLFSATILGGSLWGGQVVSAEESVSSIEQTHSIRPLVNWSGNAYLTTSAFSNVTSSNNIFSNRPTVTNDVSNAGSIKVKIVNASGKQVGATKTIGKGKSVKLDTIPWNSGTYTLKAMAVTKNGTYRIAID